MKYVPTGFSLVEVVIALAVTSFALLTLLALLPIGLESNHTSAREVRASCILTALEADLRNSSPAANQGKSRYFGLPLPYVVNASGRVALNTALTTTTASSVGLDENEETNSIASTPAPVYQASVIYTRVPAAGLMAPIEARLVVGWPCRNTNDPLALVSTSVGGFVESYVSFPTP